MIDFVKSRLFLCLDEACMLCDDTDMLGLRDEQGIIEIGIARYRLLTQAGSPGERRPDITCGQLLGARRLRYGGLL